MRKKLYNLFITSILLLSINIIACYDVGHDNTNLTGIEVSAGELSPVFSVDVVEYIVQVSNEIDQVEISAIAQEADQTIEINNVLTESAVPKLCQLNVGKNMIRIKVTAPNKESIKTYILYVKRADSNDITIHVQKPQSWQAVWMWFDQHRDGSWETSQLGQAPGEMEEYEPGWFRKVFPNTEQVEFVLNDGVTWDHKMGANPDDRNFTVSGDVWISVVQESETGHCLGEITKAEEPKTPKKNIIVYFEKPDNWQNAFIWFDENIDGVWETIELAQAPGNMYEYRPGWYKKKLDEVESAEFQFNDGVSLDNKVVKLDGSNYKILDNNQTVTEFIWITKDGVVHGKDPLSKTNEFIDGDNRAFVILENRDNGKREYTLSTNAELRDNIPLTKTVTFSENSNQPIIRTGHDMFDALYALAIEEVRQNSVEAITDGSFNNGNATDCSCFETGRLWHYVWTRDISYSVHLALASIDPTRAKNSLLYKISKRKDGSNIQIVQDTGSGGSYPISTDRVVWAIAANELLNYLEGNERSEFLETAYTAIVNTIEHDRKIVYDSKDGLYKGEQSFLDWREQSYPSWTAQNTLSLGVSKALSTNIGHYKIIDIASKLAKELGNSSTSDKYKNWAKNLKNSINSKLYIDEKKLYSTQIISDLSEIRVNKFDLLGEAFAVIFDIADSNQAKGIIESYPHTTKGAAVMHPQHAHHFTYHNRGIWPFVTSYWLKAAKKVKNAKVVDHNIYSLMRGSAINISNMENFEFITGNNADPAINSQRQLWSVAGYMSMVQDIVFGLEVKNNQIRFEPFVTKKLRNEIFSDTDKIELTNFKFKNKIINVKIKLPAKSSEREGYLNISKIKLNRKAIGSAFINSSSLKEKNNIEIILVDSATETGVINLLSNSSPLHWAPREPVISNIQITNNKIELVIDSNGESNVTYNIYRDGNLVETGFNGTNWIDSNSSDYTSKTYSYNVQSVNTAGNESFPSLSACYWGTGDKLQIVNAPDFGQVVGGDLVDNHGQWHYQNWGNRDHSIEIKNFVPGKTGEYFIQVYYGNGAGPINTGITCAVKKIEIRDSISGDLVVEDIIMMPHQSNWATWEESSIVNANLNSGRTYDIKIYENYDSINMSFFDHFSIYNGGPGGGNDPFNFVNIAAVKFLFMNP